jgi:phosphoribosyl 1,2-cyclic phosphate phosphodiesterase
MRLTILGSGTSMGVPVVGCTCPVCLSDDPRNWRTRTSALVELGGLRLLFDAGPDFRTQALACHIDALDAVLLTHSHYDHVAGLDDLRPLADPLEPMPIYGTSHTLSGVRERFSYAFSEMPTSTTRPALELVPVRPYEPFMVGGIDVMPFEVIHGSWTITGYRIGRLGYVTDASALPVASRELLHNLDVLVLNALRFVPHPTHFSLGQAMEVVDEVRPRQTFLVHLNHAFDHATVNAFLPPGVRLAYDGLRVDVAEG